jgi:hypothetical protein
MIGSHQIDSVADVHEHPIFDVHAANPAAREHTRHQEREATRFLSPAMEETVHVGGALWPVFPA